MSDSFVHLHLHTQYSTLDGAVRVKELAARAKALGMPAVAMTDHGNLYGAVEFYMACNAAGVKPILGCEIYLAPGKIDEKKEIPNRKRATHMTLLAETNEGYLNLTKLVTRGHLEGSYYGKPRVDRDTLREFSKGIICLSGCISGPVNEWLLQDDLPKAREQMAELIDIYGKENVYVEIHDHGLEIQHKVTPHLLELAKEFGLKPVAANDVHFLSEDDHAAHDVMICIGTGKQLIDQNRMTYPTSVYFKTAEEMRELFKDVPGACDATLEIAERCNVTMSLDATSSEKYPQFESPDGTPRNEYFTRVCYEGLEARYGKEVAENNQEYRDRLQYEIDLIIKLNFASYFLITADFINWGRDQGIPVGPGRGSAAGSLVAYTMGITDICPMKFGLLFERFLNPERVSPPDVDIDFCQSRRMEVIDYVRRKYGERCVSHIITYGKLGAKSVIRDVARVMGISYGEADRISKMIEAKPGVKLKEEYESKPELAELIDGNPAYEKLWSFALRLEGLVRNTGVHAAGVVIGDCELDEHVPLSRASEGEVVAQADMGAITELGLLKMDFLGLKNLTVIQEAVNHIRKHTPDFDINSVPLDDAPTFEILNRGETMGVFQLESGGMVETCKKYGMNRIEDIIDLLALYRPGAMQFIDQMIEVKKGHKAVEYEHPLLETICGDTFGVMIYQEQVQNAAKVLAGYTLGGADLLRRAMGKKKKEAMDEQRAIFIAGAKKHNDIDAPLANKIFDKIASFAGYGFNKSHSACYGHISYWTAYLKANFPVEFMCGLLSNEIQNTDKIGVFVSECHRMGIEILPPNLNKSQLRFAPEKTPMGGLAIRYGLAAIKNVGSAAMDMLIKEREANGVYESLEDVSSRLDSKAVNKRILENLVKGGAFDFAHEPRAVQFDRIESAVAAASSLQKDRNAGQVSMFDSMDFGAPVAKVAEVNDISEWTKEERLEHEKELLGFYITGHPLDRFRGVIDAEKYAKLGLLEEIEVDPRDRRQRFLFAGMVRSVENRVTKSGKPFGILTVEDFTGSVELMLWAESFVPARDAGILEPGKVIRFRGQIIEDDRTQQRKINASDIKELKPKQSAVGIAANALQLTLWMGRHGTEDLKQIKEIVQKNPGRSPVVVHVVSGTGRRALIETGENFKVARSKKLTKELAAWTEF